METYINFQEYFQQPIVSIRKITGGLTNTNYQIVTTTGQYFFRLCDMKLAHLFNRELEFKINTMIKPLCIDIPFIFFDQHSGIKISAYLDNIKTFKEYPKINKFQTVAMLLKKLHQLDTTCGIVFDVQQKILDYQRNTKNFIFNLNPYNHLIDYYTSYQDKLTICHNDVVDGNLIFTNQKAYLIDYEYACDHYPIFDLTSFITENDIIDPNIKAGFYQDYYQENWNIDIKFKTIMFEGIHHYLWCHWAMMMYEIKKDEVYYSIALRKFQQLEANYQK